MQPHGNQLSVINVFSSIAKSKIRERIIRAQRQKPDTITLPPIHIVDGVCFVVAWRVAAGRPYQGILFQPSVVRVRRRQPNHDTCVAGSHASRTIFIASDLQGIHAPRPRLGCTLPAVSVCDTAMDVREQHIIYRSTAPGLRHKLRQRQGVQTRS